MGATRHDESLHDLTPPQIAAIGALMAGGTHDEAAAAAGVHRVTVKRWVNHHPAVIAEMNRIRLDAARQTQEQLRRLTARALEVVEGALSSGDLEAAFRWLRLVPPPPVVSAAGPTESRNVVEQVRLRLSSPLEELISLGNERSTEDAEHEIAQRPRG